MRRTPPRPRGDIARPAPSRTKKSATVSEGLRPSLHPREPATPKTTVTPTSLASIPTLAPGERHRESGGGVSSLIRDATHATGQTLNEPVRSLFSTRMNTDFSDVRIHTDDKAAQAAESLHAQAFTVGRDIVFGADQYRPDSSSGQHLLAHELAHVAQPKSTSANTLSRPGDASEREADRTADAVTQGHAVQPTATATATAAAAVQRNPLPAAKQAAASSASDQLLQNASPFLAAALGSTTLSGFDTGMSELKPSHLKELSVTAHNIEVLLRHFPQSTVTVVGHTDTVGTEEHNLALGQKRAAATVEALTRLGVPGDIIRAISTGEAAPQAMKTKDETPSAMNRRVDVRFEPKEGFADHLAPKLESKAEQQIVGPVTQPATPPIDLNYKPAPPAPGPRAQHGPENLFKPIPPDPRRAESNSALDMVCKKVIDPVVDAVARPLPKEVRDKIKQGARDSVKSGAAKMARLAAEGAGVKDPQALDAIEKATEAAIQEKGHRTP